MTTKTRTTHSPGGAGQEPDGSAWGPLLLVLLFCGLGVLLVRWATGAPGQNFFPWGDDLGGVAAGSAGGQSKAPHKSPLTVLAAAARALVGGTASGEDAGPVPSTLQTTPLKVRVIGPEQDTPAAGATVYIDDAPQGVTGPDGRLTVPLPVGDEARHDLWADKGESLAEAYFIYPNDIPSRELILPLRAAGALAVSLLDPAGQPVPGATVSLKPAAAPEAVTGANGRVLFSSLPRGGYMIHAEAGALQVEEWVVVMEGETRSVELLARRTRSLRGEVLRASGQPAAGCKLTLNYSLARGPERALSCDQSGHFETPVLAGEGVILVAKLEGESGRFTGLPPSGPLTLHLNGVGAIQVSVKNPSGEPLRNLRVIARQKGQEVRYTALPVARRLDTPGDYLLDRLHPGAWKVGVVLRGDRPERWTQTEVEVAKTAKLELVFDPGKAVPLQGLVQDAQTHAPIEGATVSVNEASIDGEGEYESADRQVQTGPQGRFSLPGFGVHASAGVTVERAGYLQRRSWLRVGEKNLLELQSSRRVLGRVLDEKHLPLMEFFLNGVYRSSPDGRFDEPIPQVLESLVVSSHGTPKLKLPLPTGSETVELGDLVLEKSDPFVVLVLGPDGQPASGATVMSREPGTHRGGYSKAGITGLDGRLSMILDQGLYYLRATHPRLGGVWRPKAPLEVKPGGQETLRLEEGAYIEGQALGPGQLVKQLFKELRTESDARGHYRLGPIDPGSYRATLETFAPGAPGAPHRSPPLSLKQGQTTHYDFENASLAGLEVTFGPDIQAAQLLLVNDSGGAPPVSMFWFPQLYGARLPLTVDSLPPGDYRLTYTLSLEGAEDIDGGLPLQLGAGRRTRLSLPPAG